MDKKEFKKQFKVGDIVIEKGFANTRWVKILDIGAGVFWAEDINRIKGTAKYDEDWVKWQKDKPKIDILAEEIFHDYLMGADILDTMKHTRAAMKMLQERIKESLYRMYPDDFSDWVKGDKLLAAFDWILEEKE